MSEQSTAASGSESAPPVTSGQTKTPAPDRAHFAARRAFKRARRRAYNPFYFSPQSLALTLALVMLAAVALLALTFSLRGDAVLPVSEPIIEIINAPPAIPKADQQAGDSAAGQDLPANRSFWRRRRRKTWRWRARPFRPSSSPTRRRRWLSVCARRFTTWAMTNSMCVIFRA